MSSKGSRPYLPLTRCYGQRASSFDVGWREYVAGRPPYPGALFPKITASARLAQCAEVVEVGAGTGNFTVGLLGEGLSVVALEPGANLMRVLRDRIAASDSCQTILAPFENCDLPLHAFDAVVAAHSWHWLDGSCRILRCAALLRAGGRLCIVYNVHLHDEEEAFRSLREKIYARWAPEIEHIDPPAINLEKARAELVKSPVMGPVDEVRVQWDRRFTATEFAALIGSYSNHMVLPRRRRTRLLTEIGHLIDREFGGVVHQTFVSIALIAPVALITGEPQWSTVS